jgi:hypothetical protein
MMAVARMGCCTYLLYEPPAVIKNTVKIALTMPGPPDNLGEPVQDRTHNVARKFPDRTDAVEPSWPLCFFLRAFIGRILARRLFSLLVLEDFPLVRLRRHESIVVVTPSHR